MGALGDETRALTSEEATVLEELTLKKAVEFAAKTEELGSKFYGRIAKKFDDNKVVKEIFTILAREEVGHKKAFEGLLADLPEETSSRGPDAPEDGRAPRTPDSP